MSEPSGLRPYQAEGCDRIDEKLDEHRSTALIMATGTGKTRAFCETIRRQKERHSARAIILADRRGLVTQNAQRAREVGLSAEIEMGAQTVGSLFRPDVISACVPSLVNRLDRYDPASIGLLVVDEADLGVTPDYQAIYDHFPAAKILAVTATPDRADGLDVRRFFDSTAYTYEIRDAIEDGYLVPIVQKRRLVTSLDLSVVPAGEHDLNQSAHERALCQVGPLDEVVLGTLEYAGTRPTIVFGLTVRHAELLAERFNHYRPGSAAAVKCETDDADRDVVYQQFAARSIQFVCNYGLLIRGIDFRFVSCVVMARQTTSRPTFAQAIGRGTRILREEVIAGLATAAERRGAIAASDKPDLLVLDFFANAGRHALICPADVLDGNTDAAVRERANALTESDPELDLLTALDRAGAALAEEARQRALEEAARRRIRGRGHTTFEDVDPFVSIETILGLRLRAGRWGGELPTPSQLRYLGGKGIDTTGFDRGQCSDLIDRIIVREKRGLCDYRTAVTLARHGLNPDVSANDARGALRALARSTGQSIRVAS